MTLHAGNDENPTQRSPDPVAESPLSEGSRPVTLRIAGAYDFRWDASFALPKPGEEIAGVRSHGDLAGLHRRRKESPMSSLRVDLITDHRRSLRPDGLKQC